MGADTGFADPVRVMDPVEWGGIAGAFGAVCGVLGWMAPSPRERTLDRERSHTDRLNVLERDHRELEHRVIEAHAKFNAKLDMLTGVTTELTAALREMTRSRRTGDKT